MKSILTLFIFILFLFNINLEAQCTNGEKEFQLVIVPDNYPQEISWNLKNSAGIVLHSDNNINTNPYNFTACLADADCYTFTIFDSANDGICCNYGNGSYEISFDGTLLHQGGEYTNNESTEFSCPQGTSCENPITVSEGNTSAGTYVNNWYVFEPTQTGMFDINTCVAGNSCGNTTIYVYDYCDGLNWDDGNAATIAYSDNDCSGQLSSLSVALQAGSIYYIRIKYDNTSCSDTSIEWDLTYAGPITGCTDPTACNYNPLATQSDGSCIYPGNPNCPNGPDLIIYQDALVSSLYVDYLDNNDACLIQEGCVSGYGTRQVIRFTTHIKNIGDFDYYIGSPPSSQQSNDQWEWDPCHGHWHYEGYAEYILFDMNDGTELPIGFKNGFCVMDLECDDGGTFQYNCQNQGITAHCGDIYDSYLECQWIDVTDVEEGQYTLVIRVNWDESPDALGNHEMSYDNNWAQVCIDLSRDEVNNTISFQLIDPCDVYVDCEGTIQGNAVYDCTGTCSGTTITGDINSDATRNNVDLTDYMMESLLDTMPPTNCLDLNNDGNISVVDATLLYDCVLHGGGSTPIDHQHTPCNFPYAITNPNDIVTLTITEVNYADKYFDVLIKNPNNKMLSFEFDISGAEIDYVNNLMPNYNPNIMFDEQEIIGVSYDESTIDKHADFTPFLRIYYTQLTEGNVCIANITDFVNDDHEATTNVIENGCTTGNTGITEINNTFEVSIIPNPMSDEGIIQFNNQNNQSFNFEIFDVNGKVVYQKNNINDNIIIIPSKSLSQGVYYYRLYNEDDRNIGRFIVQQ